MEASGRKYLKVVGIIMIVFSSIGLLGSLISVIGVQRMITMGAGAVITWMSVILSVFGAAFQLFAGIFGVKNSAKTEKAKACMVIGIVLIVVQVLSSIIGYFYTLDTVAITALSTGITISNTASIISAAVGLVIGLILPILYVYGAVLNGKDA